jgi:hypothetical protein
MPKIKKNNKLFIKNLNIFLIGVVVLFSLLFFSINIYPEIFHSIELVGIGIAIIISLPFIFIKSRGIVLCMHVIVISIIISIYMAYTSWNQSYTDTIKATIPYAVWFFFFYLAGQKIPIADLEKIIIFFGILYIVLYLYQFTYSETVIFGFKNEYKQDRGITRIVFPGGSVFILALFIALNKFSENTKARWNWLFLIIFGFAIVIMQVTRITIIIVSLIYIYHFIKDAPFYKKAFTVVSVIGLVIFILFQNLPLVDGMLTVGTTVKHSGFDSDNIRVLAADFFLNKFSPSVYSQIFGNGIPYPSTKYGFFERLLGNFRGFYFFDVGVISFYVFFGIFALIALIAIIFQCYKMTVPKKNSYLKYYLFFLIFTGFTSDSLLSYNYVIVDVFVFYMFYLIDKQNKLDNKTVAA